MVLYGAAWKFISSMIAGTILATSGVVLRFVARWIGGIKTTVDDYLLLVALVSDSFLMHSNLTPADTLEDIVLESDSGRDIV